MYKYVFRKKLEKELWKLSKKNPKLLLTIEKKANEIIRNPHHYKNLRRPLQFLKRVHIQNSFVLTFSVDEENKVVCLESFEHHDNVYLTK